MKEVLDVVFRNADALIGYGENEPPVFFEELEIDLFAFGRVFYRVAQQVDQYVAKVFALRLYD